MRAMLFILLTTAGSGLHSLRAEEPSAVQQTLAQLVRGPAESRIAAGLRMRYQLPELWTGDVDRVVAALRIALSDSEPEVRQSAAATVFQGAWIVWRPRGFTSEQKAALRRNASALTAAAPDFALHLADPHPLVRESLLRALAIWMPRPPAEIASAVRARLDDDQHQVRHLALATLGRIRPVSAATLEEIASRVQAGRDLAAAIRSLDFIYGRDPGTGERLAVESLDARAHQAAVKALSGRLDDSDLRVREAARRVLELGR